MDVAGTAGPINTDGTTQTFAYSLTGIDPLCSAGAGTAANSCGIHFHSGRSCTADAGGHYFTGSVTTDPWTSISYTAEAGGSASSTVVVDTGATASDILGRVVIIHAFSGSRIACAVIEGVSPPPMPPPPFPVPMPSPGPSPPEPEVVCPTPPPPAPPDVPLGCFQTDLLPSFTPSQCTFASPCEIPYGASSQRFGCPINVQGFTSDTQQIFLKINRTRAGLLFKMKWTWEVGDSPIVVFGYSGIPQYQPASGDVYAEDYYWASRKDSEFQWEADRKNQHDAYHCAGAWCAGNGAYSATSTYCGDAIATASVNQRPCVGTPAENVGMYYVTISAYYNSAPFPSGKVLLQFAQPSSYIQPAQLAAVKELWTSTCWPTLQSTPTFAYPHNASLDPNHHWTRTHYTEGVYSSYSLHPIYSGTYRTDGLETDSDLVPFCDWFYTEAKTPAEVYAEVMAFDTQSCLDMDKVACDVSGNVIELQLSGRGLRGTLPASLAGLTMLKKLQLSYNQLGGSLPAFIFASGELETVTLTKNLFTGSIPCPSHPEPKLHTLSLSRNAFTGSFPHWSVIEIEPLRPGEGCDVEDELIEQPMATDLQLGSPSACSAL